MAVPQGTILRIVANMLFPDNVIMQNVFTAVLEVAGTSDDELDVVDDLVDWIDDMYGELSAMLDEDITPGEVTVYEYDSVDDDWDEIGAGIAGFATSSVADPLPHGVALVINGNTEDPDIQGRKYMGGLTEAQTTDGLFEGGIVAAAAAFAIAWLTGFTGTATGAEFEPSIWSPTQKIAVTLGPIAIVNLIPAYQRRRKPGVGI